MRVGLLCGAGQRLEGFTRALEAAGHPPPIHISYSDVLNAPDALDRAWEKVDALRIDSPGGGYEVWSLFAQSLGLPAKGYGDQHGLIYPQAPMQNGLNLAVSTAAKIAADKNVFCTVSPQAVKTFMDKSETHRLCVKNSIPIPKLLQDIKTCEDLEDRMKTQKIARVFMKLRYGSSASGVLAIDQRSSHLRVQTTADLQRESSQVRLYNSLRLKKYLDEDARALINAVIPLSVHTEAWIPKMKVGGKATDIRVLVIDGKPAHAVLRSSKTPITNLHLGNERQDISALKPILPEGTWEKIREVCQKAGKLFPEHLCCGVDIAVHENKSQIYVLEVNAFGDHLHDVYYQGLSPYAYIIKTMEAKRAQRE